MTIEIKPGDWIDKEDIRDKAHLERIREAVRAQGWSTGLGSAMEPEEACRRYTKLRLDEDGDLTWSRRDASYLSGRRINPTELLEEKHTLELDEMPSQNHGVWPEANAELRDRGHPAAPLLRELAEVAEWHPEPWREFEWIRPAGSGEWKPCVSEVDVLDAARRGFNIRRRPRTKRIGSYDVPLPVREALDYGQEYWIASATDEDYKIDASWGDDPDDYVWLRRGLIHLDPESAATHGRALASLMQEDEG